MSLPTARMHARSMPAPENALLLRWCTCCWQPASQPPPTLPIVGTMTMAAPPSMTTAQGQMIRGRRWCSSTRCTSATARTTNMLINWTAGAQGWGGKQWLDEWVGGWVNEVPGGAGKREWRELQSSVQAEGRWRQPATAAGVQQQVTGAAEAAAASSSWGLLTQGWVNEAGSDDLADGSGGETNSDESQRPRPHQARPALCHFAHPPGQPPSEHHLWAGLQRGPGAPLQKAVCPPKGGLRLRLLRRVCCCTGCAICQDGQWLRRVAR